MTLDLFPQWSAAQVMAAMSAAIRDHNMRAAAELLVILESKDPASAALIRGALDLARHVEDT